MKSYLAQISNLQKIKIVQGKSNTEIPDNIHKHCYSSKANITISINNFTKSSIFFNIEDKNKLPYIHTQMITKFIKSENKDYHV